ncbi:hypothetical protein IMG5_201360 [Ichthyophthirius multifiliis]|uniref:Uncharacterized protein n=1 Tax=Ichthyophthirius multifiliis TaxID=5932 RepID=G0R5Z0_ICHMU|nr:hypothetical protein IMG5_201360 [Ichthyophthirius multifiliis]EGR27114.1 hypothetical protein IMG5_201360 [Ichthyophthirius multifiliis]|eukprot:XP_004023998.1 hypothetical protein IMG5_201360 [Ichthyophthirius multifiliis]
MKTLQNKNKLTLEQSVQLLQQVILQNCLQNDQKVLDLYFSIEGNWNLQKLIKEFKNIFDDKTTLMEYYTNWKKNNNHSNTSNVFEISNHSFKPQINDKSRVIDQSKSQIHQNRYDQLYEQYKEKQEKQSYLQIQKVNEEIEGCTFKPKINKLKDQHQERIKQEKAYEKLYKLHDQKQSLAKEAKELYEFQKQEQELENCTFFPQKITNSKHNQSVQSQNNAQLQDIKGFNQQLRRMYKARKEKLEKQMFYQKQRYQLSQNNQNNIIKSFNLANKQQNNQNKQLIGHIDINITKSKKAKIVLYEGDNPIQKAKSFVKIHNISHDITLKLAEMIEQYLNQHQQQINN